MELLYRSLAQTAKAGLRIMGWRVQVSGAEVIPQSGAAVLAANHISFLDPVLLGYAADVRGRTVRFLGKEEMWSVPIFGSMLRRMRHISVDRHGLAGTALPQAIDRLEDGDLVGVYPEATISPAFFPFELKTGAARMALAVEVPLIPVALWGAQRIATKWHDRDIRRNVTLTVRCGAPLRPRRDDDPGEVTEALRVALGELVEASVAAHPEGPRGPDDRWWIPAHLGGTAPDDEEARALMARSAAERRAARERRNPPAADAG